MNVSSLALINADVVTLDPRQPKAQAIYVEGDRIVAVGTNETVKRCITEKTNVCNAKGASVVPGLVDCHVHMTSFGKSLIRLDLSGARSISDLQHRLSRYARRIPNGSWVVGRGWDQERFTERRYPTREDLDAAVEDKPVLVVRVCGHVGTANTEALRLARISRMTVVDGGETQLDSEGQLNGVLKENALEEIYRAIPKLSNDELERTLRFACSRAVRSGLTCVHWLVDSPEEFRALQHMRARNELPLRVYLGISGGLLNELVGIGLETGFGDSMLRIGFIKFFADGSLGARTAALEKPYEDDRKNVGILLLSQKRLNELVQRAHDAGFQIGVHAIGDRAICSVVRAYAKALKNNPRDDHRHRVEHCSVLDRGLINALSSLEVVASIQPHFVVSDTWVKSRVGKERARMVYPIKTLTREGVLVISGSDCPIESISPLFGIWAATSQQPFAGENLTVKEALETYTTNAAKASFDEHERGIIKPGYLADFTMLSKSLFDVPPEEIRDIDVEMTIVGGRIVYSRGSYDSH